MPLTDAQCRAFKPLDKPYKKGDSGGLYLEIKPNGKPNGVKYWRYRYRFEGKQKLLALGVFPAVLLAEARAGRDQAKTTLRAGIDPSAARKEAKAEAVAIVQNTFENIAREWFSKMGAKWTDKTAQTKIARLERDIFPVFGAMPIKAITKQDVLKAVALIERRGCLALPRRILQDCSAIFTYAANMGIIDHDPTWGVGKTLRAYKEKNHPHLKPDEIPAFLKDLAAYTTLRPQTLRAMRFMMLTFQRTTETIRADWREIDWEAKVWRIPADNRKKVADRMQDHAVPLSRQALALLEEQRAMTGGEGYIWPITIRPNGHMSNQTLLEALRRMGYGGKLVPHGFRGTATTAIVEKLGIDPKIPDLQLSHSDKDRVAAAYNHAPRMAERITMMQEWADYLEGLQKA